jgi:hypothetical protein
LNDTTDRKLGVVSNISQATILGNANPTRYTDSAQAYSWTDGTPNLAATTTSGIYVTNLNNGFRITASADTTIRRLKIYVEVYGARGKFQATLSDFSSPTFTGTGLESIFGTSTAVYSIDYAAASAGQTLIVNFTSSFLYDEAYGNVALQAAALVPPVQLLNPAVAGNIFTASFLSDLDYTYTVEFNDSLIQTNWQAMETLLGNGTNLFITHPNAGVFSNRFYRVKME